MKNAVSLTSEGFGYHTFELKWNPSHTEFFDAKEFLKSVSAHDQFYPLGQYGNGRWFCSVLCQYGIRIYMTETENKNIIKLIINPRLLIEPNSTYLGIMPNDSRSFERLEHAFTDCMRRVHLPDFLEDWTLSRLDLCVNIQWSKKRGPHELLRLLRKEPTPAGYERNQFRLPDGSAYSETRNTHILKFSNSSIALVAYDKVYQIRHEKLNFSNEFIPKGILRVELQCKRAWILKYTKKNMVKSTTKIMQALAGESRELICSYAQKLYHGGQHYKLSKLRKTLRQDKKISRKVGKRMIYLSEKLGETKYVEKALSKIDLTDKKLRICWEHFDRLKINPIPLEDDYPVNQMDSLLNLLQTVEEDGTAFTYTKRGKKLC